ncbi:MAG: glycosyltransferase [Phycisphaeraceae bacterium]
MMQDRPLNIVVLGLSMTSSWGNGHATIYRALVKSLIKRQHRVLFLERDMPWYASARDAPPSAVGPVRLYDSLDDLITQYAERVRSADLVIVGSFVPDGHAVGRWVNDTAEGFTAFYDIDTPVTLAAMEKNSCDYLDAELLRRFSIYLSFTGGPTVHHLRQRWGAAMAKAFYCCVDVDAYPPAVVPSQWDLGYMGTYSDDRQPKLEKLLIEPARKWPEGRFVVAGPQYPEKVDWPDSVERVDHLAPPDHPEFYHEQRFTLNLTRSDMVRAGYSPSVRLFEAAACGTPIISDWWEGLDQFFEPDTEILIADDTDDVLRYLRRFSEDDRRQMAHRARQRVLREHSSDVRAVELEGLVEQLRSGRGAASPSADAAAG